jgi:hypothetical protein
MKIRAEINEMETKRTIQRINEIKTCCFEKINQINLLTKREKRHKLIKLKIRKRIL